MKNKIQNDRKENNNSSFGFNHEENFNSNEYIDNVGVGNKNNLNEEVSSVKNKDKPLKVLGWVGIVAFISTIMFIGDTSPDTSEAAHNALKEKVSTTLSAGTVLLSSDENIGEQDYTINHNSQNDETKIWVWDYAAEDGDYVQVLVNGTPTSDPFMIKHKPKEITVPSVGDIQVKGIKDGGGGITYAVRYELNGTNYFNSAPEGDYNTYTLIRE